MAEDKVLKDLIKKRGSVKGRLTKFIKYIETFDKGLSVNQMAEVRLRTQGATGLYTEFNNIQSKIEDVLPETDLDAQLDARDEFEAEYYSIMAQAEKLVKDEVKIDSDKSSNALKSVKLPTISLPSFDGSHEHWIAFRDTFSSLVHNSQEISDIQKFHYLKSSLTGSAQLVIDSIEFSTDNYNIAWELLLNRYNNNRLLIHNHVKALFSMQTLQKESPVLLRKLIDNVLKNIRALKALKEPVDSWDTLLIYMIVSKLDSTTEREWEQHKGSLSADSIESKLTIDDLLSFLRGRADMLETLIVTHSKTNSQDSKKYTNSNYTPKVHCNVATEKPQVKTPFKKQFKLCPMCSEKHPLYSCQSFLDLNMKDRLQLVSDKNLCENCLRTGHTADLCRYGPCRKCDKKHNSIIHRDEVNVINTNSCPGTSKASQNKPNEPHTSTGKSSSYSITNHAHIDSGHVSLNTDVQCAQASVDDFDEPVLLTTALIEIVDDLGIITKACALLDNGSERCIISQSLCDKLNTRVIQSTRSLYGVDSVILASNL
ncbi:uncharacterized protein LOC125225976 [Leguminivora glycinivorella]|uniref:uncharacterized protein LOC125225976 n=1 Tax=Leguminivora glycinivorella TaxID=1035111 RepID=UPI00200BB22A|nr:uncharacterized protein LOC125225976 [Leguminivora glycinivorella]